MVKKNETVVVGVRMPEKLKTRLERIANERNQSINQIAKTAIIEWLDILAYAQKLRFMIITRGFFQSLLEIINEDQMEPLAEEMADLTAEIFRDTMKVQLSHSTIKNFTEVLPRFMRSSGLKWFDDFRIDIEENIIIFRGFHYMGLGFSKFFTNLTMKLLKKYFDADLLRDKIDYKPNSIFLEFQLN